MISKLGRYKPLPSKTEKGFTLLEAITVISIVGILSAVAVSSGFNFYVRLQIEEAQNTIYSAIRTARSNAIASAGSGRAWAAQIDTTGSIPVVLIEDIGGICDDILPCQRLPLSNLVEVTNNLPNNRVAFNSRGARLVEAGGASGSFRVTSPSNTAIELCVTVSDAVFGLIRKDCP